MKCPLDGNDLVIADRQGVEIDYCPKCRGVWLDRGELDKLIERSEAYDKRDRSRDRDDNDRYDNDRNRDYDRSRDDRHREGPYRSGGAGEGIAGILGEALNKKMGSSGHHGHSSHHSHKKKKGGLLGELFDF
jgi:hypothetical protein